MAEEIAKTSLNEDCVYFFPRHNYFNGKFIKWCGWYPDRQIRLYNRKKTRFTDVQVHEAIISNHLKQISLRARSRHFSYASIADFLTKMQSLFRSILRPKMLGKKHSSPLKAILHGMFAFVKSYFLKKGFLGGYEGFVISAYNGHTAFYKYLKLYEINKKTALD